MTILLVGVLVMFVPTYVRLDREIWSVVGQGHGPVMLMLTLWLAYQRWGALTSLPSRAHWGGALCIGVGFCAYVAGRSQDILMAETIAQVFVLSGLLLLYRGTSGLKLMWFPLFFMVFLIPMPGPVVDALTAPLKAAVSFVAEQLLYAAGYPIGRAGVTLSVGPYQLMVADACAGLNSIFALEAIGVFYMSVVGHKEKWRNVMLAVLILPISFVSNVVRVVVLVLVTYYWGDEAGQGFVHDFAGILLFMVATALTIMADNIIGFFVRLFRRRYPV